MDFTEILLNSWSFCKLASLTYAQALKYFNFTSEFTLEELKSAYKAKALKLHPDQNKSSKAHEQFLELRNAYDVLKNSHKPTSVEPEPEPEPEPESEEQYEDLDEVLTGERPWRHQYYTPIDQYDDLEKWEYYTNPEIQKQYERDFAAEQETSRNDYERDQEQAWEADRDNSYDNALSIKEKLESIDPETLLKAFAKPADEAIKILGLSRNDIDRKRFTKKDFLTKEIAAAIYQIIVEEHPESAGFLILALKDNPIDLHNYLPNDIKAELVISADDFVKFVKSGIVGLHSVYGRKDAAEILTQLKRYLLEQMLSDEWFNALDAFYKIKISSPEMLDDYRATLLEMIGNRQPTRHEQGILNTIDRIKAS